MTGYVLQDTCSSNQAVQKLKKHLKGNHILEIGLTSKEEAFVRTEWYVYVAKLRANTVKIPVMWSAKKKPYLIAGILTVLFCMFFIGGLLTDFVVIGVLFGLGMVNVFKRREINQMKQAMYDALDQ